MGVCVRGQAKASVPPGECKKILIKLSVERRKEEAFHFFLLLLLPLPPPALHALGCEKLLDTLLINS